MVYICLPGTHLTSVLIGKDHIWGYWWSKIEVTNRFQVYVSTSQLTGRLLGAVRPTRRCGASTMLSPKGPAHGARPFSSRLRYVKTLHASQASKGVGLFGNNDCLRQRIPVGIESYLLRRYLDPPNLQNSVSNHLLRRYLDP